MVYDIYSRRGGEGVLRSGCGNVMGFLGGVLGWRCRDSGHECFFFLIKSDVSVCVGSAIDEDDWND